MLTDVKVTKISVMADEFCKVFNSMLTALSFKISLLT